MTIRPGITSKLFFAILFTCVVAAVAMATAMRTSFNEGFLGYLNEQEEQRLEALAPTLAQAYEENGNWDFLRDNPRRWFSLIRPPGMPAADATPAERRQPPPESDLTGLNLRVSLLDAQKNLVIGNPRLNPNAKLKAVNVAGQTVGWVALVPFQQVSTGAALRFQEQQLKASLVIGGIVILLAALVAWLLARMLLAPVKHIADSTHRLAAGDYASRVAVSSKDELGQLAEDFNRLAVTLDKNEKLRRAFMADVSHELRTPLAVLKGELEALQDGVRPLTPAAIHSLQAEVATLGKLIDDLYELSLSDVGALSYKKAPVDVLEVLHMTADAFQDRFAQQAIALELRIPDHPAICHADPNRLRQLFSNLLENSVRYTDAGGNLIISAIMEQRMLKLVFEDSKPGVPDHMLPQLFERFFRGEQSRNRGTGGAGLGLAISRNIVEAHQGTIAASESPLGGVRITVTLPMANGAPT
ncbi:two-component system sensor histidine kinase BaeS [Paucimonas lemoignei]|uniref:histidine kinase n=1 Tax=Paucimonas lemoignei TaxID=29443 RepID=A0A4R3HTI3_PAULE|nr:sensor histidine kinase efflux regulator BaeS [Paucimonas lemoignei]TCS36298.1 two-component system sensor histidine kinase BaeS [Paucimonas lemoignei]